MLHCCSLSYIIVQPEFTPPVGMRNRLCHEMHLCHCNLECDIRQSVNENHMAMTRCPLKSNFELAVILSTSVTPASRKKTSPLCCFIAYICRSEAILLNWVTPFIPIACLVRGGWGKKGCAVYVHLKKSSLK